MSVAVDTRWCKQCKRDLPLSEFLWARLRIPRVRITKCNSCAQQNMRQWAATALRRIDPDKARARGVEE